MEYTDLTKEQLADNFERVANDFYKLIKDNGLEYTEVDMDTPLDNRAPELNLCNTPACHGGWASIMYGIEVSDEDYNDFYELGAERLSEELGLDDDAYLEYWADKYPKYWGNAYGENMFDSKEAFGKDCGEALSLKDIADWYMAIAKRLRGGA